jgi:acetyl esterase/lipase
MQRTAKNRRWFGVTTIVFALGVVGCHFSDLNLWHCDSKARASVEEIRGIDYTSHGLDSYRHTSKDRSHQLDLFLPRGSTKRSPVVVFVHGGAWMLGDNRCCGLYSSVGQFLASQGIIAVMPNYRLSPAVKHPEHAKDVARAVAWVMEHIGDYGGRTDQVFLMGHSAGGHLVSLLATDEQYLTAAGVSPSAIKGVIAVSGVYRLTPEAMNVTLGGRERESISWGKMMPLRGDSPPAALAIKGIPLNVDIFGPPFGGDPQIRHDASPINHVRAGLPPFLVCFADNDLPSLPEMAVDFNEALCLRDVDAKLLRVPLRNHNSIMFQAIRSDDPVGGAVLDFVSRHTSEK